MALYINVRNFSVSFQFLTKQNNAMKEESVTRAKFYEQLESTIFELERTNTQLTRKHDSDKKRIRR